GPHRRAGRRRVQPRSLRSTRARGRRLPDESRRPGRSPVRAGLRRDPAQGSASHPRGVGDEPPRRVRDPQTRDRLRYGSGVRALVVFAIACSSDTPPTPPIDAKLKIDAPPAACTGVVYDPCTDPSQCTTDTCHTFGSNLEVCTETCTPNDNSTC